MSHRGAVAATSSGTLANNYYTAIVLGGLNSTDSNGARRAIAISGATGINPLPTGEATTYDISGITVYAGNKGISHNTHVYAGATESVVLNLNYIVPEQHVVKEITDGWGHTLTDNGDGTHTIIMYDKAPTIRASIYIPVTAETTFNNDVYRVNSDVTFTERIVISGNVKLIIEEGCTVTAAKGIDVNSGNSLTIEGSGTLNATGSDYNAGIGGTTNYSSNQSQHGRITINGCTVNATGGKDAAGIGGSNNSTADENSVVTINGGVVNATGGSRGAGIGGGFRYWGGDGYGMPGTIIINGGQVTARKGEGACGIGKGNATTGDSGSLTMGWTKASDFIDVDSYNMPNISVANDKSLTDGTNIYVNSTPESTLRALTDVKLLPANEIPLLLADNADNSTLINTFDGQTIDVTLAQRTLYPDESWNTLCLPFSLPSLSGTPLVGTKVKELTSSSFTDETLTLYFSENLTSIEAGKPYIVRWNTELVINSKEEWKTFVSNVNDGIDSYEGKIVKLNTDDIVINSTDLLVGTDEHRFKGIFDGKGHTLTYSFASPDFDNLAIFRYIDGATIQNLRVGGLIDLNLGKQTGGLVSIASGTVTISNCVVSTKLIINYISYPDGWNGSGGFIGQVDNGSNVTFNNCAFIGQLLRNASYSNHIGGFIGGNETPADFNVTFNSCLFDPIDEHSSYYYELTPTGNRVFTYYGNATYNNAYYKKAYDPDAPQGEYTAASGSKLVSLLGADWEESDDKVVPKMNATAAPIVSPTFTGVTLDKTINNTETDYVDFVGSYAPVTIDGEDNTMLYLGADNSLYYPSQAMTINAFRGYFRLKGIEIGNPAYGAQRITMVFKDSETTGIDSPSPILHSQSSILNSGWYTLDGRKLNGKPTQKGIYIYNGKKILY